ncbi:hypothetical protein [Pseudobacter ginsenosidimutans]|uniref:Uncharacterized protein n=1 Tax=Pseudobacter ginsenosidimutans TaxID=661488 RepID=A0A4Q7MTS9_9BACT|nr:hypothetical protein [Pseudobacter ginsenosidimutans]QEC40999.1 hypothetical protein FSB84_04555 [Pseudobacter ginsenosidimutans]RZS72255.1 hypothetical protein EV199_4171 [Pseudobacter ginsenosidimutans]
MKKTTALLLIAAPLVFSACKKSKDSDSSIYELPYNTENVTANKAFMETEGREFVKKIDDLSSNPAIDALENFNMLEAPEVDITVNAIKKLGAGTLEIAAINSALSSITTTSIPEKKSYQLSKAYGIYKYNQNTGNWDLTASNDKIEFHFPATQNGTSNNTVLTITYKNSGKSWVFNSTHYDYVENPETGNYEIVEVTTEETYELPSELSARMTINSSEVMNLSSNFSYHEDKLPQLVNVNLSLGAYTAKLETKNDNKLASFKFSFAKGAETLMALETNSNFNSLSYDKLVNSEDDEELDLFLSANTTFAVGNVTMGGQIDYKAMHNELKTVRDREPAYPDYNTYYGNLKYPKYEDYNNQQEYQAAVDEYWDKVEVANNLYDAAFKKYLSDNEKYEKEYYTLLANLLNKHGAAVVVNTKTKKKIAAITFELKDNERPYGETTIHEYNVEPLLVFGDGSKVSFEAFGETGFENLIDDIEALLEKFEN